MSTASTTIAAGSSPDPSDLWFPAALFTAHWGSRVEVVTNFRTAIQSAVSTAEQRSSLSSLPFREVRTTLQGFGESEAGSLMAAAHRYARAKSLIPIYCDQIETTQAHTTGNTVINTGPTADTRISVGGRVTVLAPGMNPASQHVSVVTAKGANSVTLSTGLNQDFPRGSRIMPLIESQVRLTTGGSGITDDKITLDLSAIEVAGKNQMDLLSAGSFSTHDGLPIFDLPIDWSQPIAWTVERKGDISPVGIGDEVTLYGSRGATAFSFEVVNTSRELAFRSIRFFEERAGQLKPFWFVSPISQYSFISRAGSVVRVAVSAKDFNIDWDARPYIALRAKNGTVQIREVSSVAAVSSGVVDVTTDTAFTIADADVSRAAVAYKVRFNSDELVESWITTNAMRCSMGVIEVLEEKTVTVTGFSELTSSDLLVRFDPGNCAGFSVEGCFTLCSEPTITVRSPAKLTVEIYAWGYGLGESVLFQPGYVGTDVKFDDTGVCTGTKLAGVPYTFVYYYSEANDRFELAAGESDTPPCDYMISDVTANIPFRCEGTTDADFFGVAANVPATGTATPPSEVGFAFSGNQGGFGSLADVDSYFAQPNGFYEQEVYIGDTELLVYKLTAEGISHAACTQTLVSDCGPFTSDCGQWSFLSIDSSGGGKNCVTTAGANDSACVESYTEGGNTFIWIGCYLNTLTADQAAICGIGSYTNSIVCCYVEVEGEEEGI
jgi:hypothetical protein